MKSKTQSGFTILEIMVVVGVIGILALMSMPSIRQATNRAEATITANDLKKFGEAVEFYSTESGAYPNTMTYSRVPELVAEYLPKAWLNGNYSWFYINSSRYTYIYVYNLKFTAEQAVQLDQMIDDGNISDGKIRVAVSGTGLIYLFRIEDWG